MAEQRAYVRISRWPTMRTWIVAGIGLIALFVGLAAFPDAVFVSVIRQLLIVLALIGLLHLPEKRIRLIEEDDVVLIQVEYRYRGRFRLFWPAFARPEPAMTIFAAPRESMARATPYALSWGDWWAAVRHGGRIERLGGHAILLGFKRRGIAILVDEESKRLSMNSDIAADRTVIMQTSIAWGLYESESITHTPAAAFVFVPLEDSVELLRTAIH